ncbi:MAG: hypothetical protein IKF01_03425 [Bacilli bacterium]|nr:hypothetical protein [Bacilli bacterium]
MELDFYSLEKFKKKLRKLSFLELQRLVDPIIDLNEQSQISSVILDEYYFRMEKMDLSIDNISIDDLIRSLKEDKDTFNSFTDSDINYLTITISNVIYRGNVYVSDSLPANYLGTRIKCKYYMEDGKPYIHYDYDKKLKFLNELLKKEENRRFCRKSLEKYGINYFDEMTYEDISDLITSMAFIGNCENANYNFDEEDVFKTDYYKLFNGLCKILNNMDNYRIPNDLKKVDYNNLCFDKLKRLEVIFDLALDLSIEDSLESVKNIIDSSHMVVDISELNEAFNVCAFNGNDVIMRAAKELHDEIENRYNRCFIKYYMERVSIMFNDMKTDIKIKRR